MQAILLAREESRLDLVAIKRREAQIQDVIVRTINRYAGNLSLSPYQLNVTYATVLGGDPVASDHPNSNLLVRLAVPLFNEFIEDNRMTIEQDIEHALRDLLEWEDGNLDVSLIFTI